jgi:tetratricopeptide (TPR) repeat protein
MPVANLQTYRTVGLNVRSTAFASQGLAMFLESATLQHLQQQCRFDQIVRAGQGAPPDVVIDLNITNHSRGDEGLLSNQNVAIIDTLLVLTDGQSNDLLGTARIRGRSSGIVINDNPPEREAVDAVAKSVADLLAKSGCSGPRLAKAEPPPPPPNTGSGANAGSASGSNAGSGEPTGSQPDETHRAEAEQLNEQGKDKLRSADIAGALAAFQQANQLVPDPKYQYNVCLAYEAGERWQEAIGACQKARSMNPPDKLAQKIDHRLDLLKNHQ